MCRTYNFVTPYMQEKNKSFEFLFIRFYFFVPFFINK